MKLNTLHLFGTQNIYIHYKVISYYINITFNLCFMLFIARVFMAEIMHFDKYN